MDNLARINPANDLTVNADTVDDVLQDEIRTCQHARMQRLIAKVEKEDARLQLAITDKKLAIAEVRVETALIDQETEEIKAQTESITVETEAKKSQLAILRKLMEKRKSQNK